MAHTWDPDRYLTFACERGRPFIDLITRIGATAPRTVVDLGCGPGNLTELLADRWPDAEVTGLDSSPAMIEKARSRGGRVDYEVADAAEWTGAVDVLVSNATLQWIPDHLALLPKLVASVKPGGWFAFQVPGNFEEPSHTIRRDLANEAPYAEFAADADQPDAHDATTYLSELARLGCEVDAWETTYLHVLTGEDPVFTWVSGTGARPTLQALEPHGLREPYETEFKRRLRIAYPDNGFGVVLPFRRVFAVARVS